MGIFPITMNILQFWLIDSIVKASTSTLVLENSPDLSRHLEREPLFRASDDEDDEDHLRRHDIEDQRSLPRSLSRGANRPTDDKSVASSMQDEHKSTGSASDQAIEPHSYPPSLSSSLTSTSSSSNKSNGSPRPAHNLLKKAKRRPAPAPLSIRNLHAPAVNSPSVAPPHQDVALPIAAPKPEVGKESDGWAETWEEDDWEHRLGDSDLEVDHRGNKRGSDPINQ